jgi:hypothetical protein
MSPMISTVLSTLAVKLLLLLILLMILQMSPPLACYMTVTIMTYSFDSVKWFWENINCLCRVGIPGLLTLPPAELSMYT